jgi:amidohydrolase
LILEAERYIWQNPETGYKEIKTSAYLAEKFRSLGYELTMAEGITGFYTVVDTGKEGPCVMVLGELDSVICPGHPESDKITGAVHSCGHNAQCAALLGVAAALREEGVLDGLSGRIKLCAVPAEELLEIEYRMKLKAEGKISFLGGKSEFLSRGYFDDVDIAFMVHTTSGGSFATMQGSVGCVTKKIIYKGQAAHAGGSPWSGRNALYAATLGINAANAIRERFKEADVIRFHPIITQGGAMVNAIPEIATLESYVRGKTYPAILAANKQINQALVGAALSVGTNIEIIDMPGYAPNQNSADMIKLAGDALGAAYPDEPFSVSLEYSSGSTDMGDLSCIMPTIHPYAPGAKGTSHGADYYIADPNRACVQSAVWQVTMLSLLLSDGASRAKQIISDFKPQFTKNEFLAHQNSIFSDGDRIVYSEDGATVKI